MKKFLLLLLLIGLSGCAAEEFGAGEKIDFSKFQEVKMVETKIGDEYALRYKNLETGNVEIFEVTKEEYEDVALRNRQPQKAGYAFVGGYGGRPIIATSTPVLNDGEYFIKTPQTTTTEAVIMYKQAGEVKITNQNISK